MPLFPMVDQMSEQVLEGLGIRSPDLLCFRFYSSRPIVFQIPVVLSKVLELLWAKDKSKREACKPIFVPSNSTTLL